MADNMLDLTTYKKLKYGVDQIDYENRELKSHLSQLEREKKEAQKYLDAIAKLEAKIETSKKIIDLAEKGEYLPSYVNENQVQKSYEADAEFHTWEITYVLVYDPKDGKPVNIEKATVFDPNVPNYLQPETNVIHTKTVTLPEDQVELTSFPHYIHYTDHYFTAGQSYGSPSACTEYYGPDHEDRLSRVCVILKMEKKWENSIGHRTSLLSVLLSKCFRGHLSRRQNECNLRVEIQTPDDTQEKRKKQR